MKWTLAIFLLSTTAWAQNKCDRLTTFLKENEQKLHAATLKDCGTLTPQALGLPNLTDEELEFFNRWRCQNLATVDIQLGTIENQLIVIDGVKDLRDQTIAAKATLAASTSWTTKQEQLAKTFAKDVTLGATIQAVVESPVLHQLFEVETRGPQWSARLEAFCAGQSERAASRICSMWKSYGPTSSAKALDANDFFAFLDDLKPMLGTDRKLPEAKRNEVMAFLKLQHNDRPSDFASYQESLDKADLYSFLQPQPPRTLSTAQTQFLRREKLSVPSAGPEMNSLKSLAQRILKTKDMLQVKSTQDFLKSTLADASNRFEARIKARWASLAQRMRAPTPPCMGEATGAALRACMQSAWESFPKTSLATQDQALFRGLLMATQDLDKSRQQLERCSKDDVVQAIASDSPTPVECNDDLLFKRSEFEINRKILTALRDRMQTQEDKRIRFRSFAFNEMRSSCSETTVSVEYAASPSCMNMSAVVPFGPTISLMTDTLAIFNEGLKSPTRISDDECREGDAGEYLHICNIAMNRDQGPERGTASSNPSTGPVTPRTDAPTRTKDPIVAESVMNAINEVAKTWLNVRQSQLPQVPTNWMPSYRPMPYSQPITMSMSDYVINTARFSGGYGQYYSCPSCGVGAGQAFNNYWGTSAAPVPGMGGPGLGGTSLSSRFFGASTAGFVSF